MALEYKIIVFIIISAGLFWLSRRSLRSVRSHGFYRFFAWITFLAIALINLDYWFDEPFGVRQIASWILLSICVFIGAYGTISLHRAGAQGAARDDELLIGIEKTTRLVTAGPYRYIRHPMYSSFLFGAWGAFLKHYSWLSFIMACLTTFFTILTARMEEAENIRYFGDIYRNYKKRTRMFIPYLF